MENKTRIFKTKRFAKLANKERLSDKLLYSAVCEMDAGLVDAALGGQVFKKRVASEGRESEGVIELS